MFIGAICLVRSAVLLALARWPLSESPYLASGTSLVLGIYLPPAVPRNAIISSRGLPFEVVCSAGGRQAVPSRSMAHAITSSLRATATMASFLRDFLPPLIRW